MYKTTKLVFQLLFCISVITASCSATARESVSISDGHFVKDGKEYRFIGANFWYGAILGSEGQGGDRVRLRKELDDLKSMGINNLRILVGSDGVRGGLCKVEPTLQESPGVYNDTILAGLDYLLAEMGKRDMVAVLYLNNAWEWSGGYGYYLEQAGEGKCPLPNIDGYRQYVNHVAKFADNEKAHKLFYQYIRDIISRKNRYTGIAYKDDPTIMSWQIGNEPRAFSEAAKPGFVKWLREASALIRQLDPNHLISIGSEGTVGCEMDEGLYEQICSDDNIDYMNLHLWPMNWGWVSKDRLTEDMDIVEKLSEEYMANHVRMARKLHKPLVMEEFGYPRDGKQFAISTPTRARDHFYDYVLRLMNEDSTKLDGVNFWGWNGQAKPKHENWQPGDDYCCDPAQEPQGLYGVFAKDSSTIEIIKEAIKSL